MNWDQIEGKWKQVQGKVLEKWERDGLDLDCSSLVARRWSLAASVGYGLLTFTVSE